MYGMIGAGKTVLEKFELLKEAGFDGVEMDSPTKLPVEEIKAASEKTGILIEGEVDCAIGRDALPQQPKGSSRGLAALETALRDCKTLGGTSVLLVPGVVDQSVAYDDCWKRLPGTNPQSHSPCPRAWREDRHRKCWNHLS